MHKLTEKLWGEAGRIGGRPVTRESYDSIIRTELGKMATILEEPYKHPTPRIRQVLGLSPQQEPEPVEPRESCFCDQCTWRTPVMGFHVFKPKPKTAEEWWSCHCQTIRKFSSDYKFCPLCSAPRPKVVEKSLTDKFEEYLKQPRMPDYRLQSMDLLDIVTEHNIHILREMEHDRRRVR